jgi:hypothetical protein
MPMRCCDAHSILCWLVGLCWFFSGWALTAQQVCLVFLWRHHCVLRSWRCGVWHMLLGSGPPAAPFLRRAASSALVLRGGVFFGGCVCVHAMSVFFAYAHPAWQDNPSGQGAFVCTFCCLVAHPRSLHRVSAVSPEQSVLTEQTRRHSLCQTQHISLRSVSVLLHFPAVLHGAALSAAPHVAMPPEL